MQTRREFLSCTGCTLLLAGCSVGSKEDSAFAEEVEEDSATSVPDYDPCATEVALGWTEIPLSDYPDLSELNSYAYVSVGGKNLIIAHVVEGCFVALSSNCTHEGETIYYQGGGGRFVCPLHGATFDWQGLVQGGPAPTSLTSYPIALESDALWIDLS